MAYFNYKNKQRWLLIGEQQKNRGVLLGTFSGQVGDANSKRGENLLAKGY